MSSLRLVIRVVLIYSRTPRAAGLSANGASVELPAGSASYAAIDTGTSLVIGPTAGIEALYSQIPGSEALSGQNEGYWAYRTSRRPLPPHNDEQLLTNNTSHNHLATPSPHPHPHPHRDCAPPDTTRHATTRL